MLVPTLVVAAKKSTKRKTSTAPAFNKAYLQKIWDGWELLDPFLRRRLRMVSRYD